MKGLNCPGCMRLYLLVFVLIGFLVFANALPNGFIDDDYYQIVNNPLIRSVKNIPLFFAGSTYFREETGQSYGLYYRPLMLSFYTLIYRVGGLDPLYFHLFQLILHISNAILIFFIFKEFFSRNGAFLASLIFLIHPLNQEAVVFIADLQDVLFVFFGLISLQIVSHSRRFMESFIDIKNQKSKIKTTLQKSNILTFLLIGSTLLLSLFSKESGILFVAIIGVYIYLFYRQKLKQYTYTVVFVLLVYSFFRFQLAGSHISDQKLTPISQAPFLARLINTPKIWEQFFTLLVYPKNLSLNQMWLVKSLRSSQFIFPSIVVISISIALATIAQKMRKRSKKVFAQFTFFLMWLIIGLLLHSQIIALNATFTTRWFYFPTIGVIGVMGVTGESFLKRFARRRFIMRVLAICIVLEFFIRTVYRNFDWRDEMTLFTRDIKTSGGNYYLSNNLASIFIREKKYDEAKVLVASSIRQFPYFGNLNNMAIIFSEEKKYDEAENYFLRALKEKGNYMVYQNYANFLFSIKKDPSSTIRFLEKSIVIYPKSRQLWLLLAAANEATGNKVQAVLAAQNACTLKKDDVCKSILDRLNRK